MSDIQRTPKRGQSQPGLARSSWYYTPAGESAENLELMRQLDEQYTRTRFYGTRGYQTPAQVYGRVV